MEELKKHNIAWVYQQESICWWLIRKLLWTGVRSCLTPLGLRLSSVSTGTPAKLTCQFLANRSLNWLVWLSHLSIFVTYICWIESHIQKFVSQNALEFQSYSKRHDWLPTTNAKLIDWLIQVLKIWRRRVYTVILTSTRRHLGHTIGYSKTAYLTVQHCWNYIGKLTSQLLACEHQKSKKKPMATFQ